MTSPSDPPVLTLRSPHDILEAVPFLLGFEPADCLVALSLRGRRQRLGLTLRIDAAADLSSGEGLDRSTGVSAAAGQVATALLEDGARSVVLVGYGDPASAQRVDRLVGAVRAALRAVRVEVSEALRVVSGRWTSYTCESSSCCPPEGTPVPDRLAAPGHVSPMAVVAGRQVLPGRRALADTLAPVDGLLAGSMHAALERQLSRRAAVSGVEALREYAGSTVELTRSTLLTNPVADGDATGALCLPVENAARLIVGMLDVDARDACLDGWDGDALPPLAADLRLDDQLRPGADRLWAELVRLAVLPGLVAPVATLLAWNLYIHHGGGALMTIALERAVLDEPGYVMAAGLLSLLGGGVSPRRFAELVAPHRRR